jgi:hypothetical protein
MPRPSRVGALARLGADFFGPTIAHYRSRHYRRSGCVGAVVVCVVVVAIGGVHVVVVGSRCGGCVGVVLWGQLSFVPLSLWRRCVGIVSVLVRIRTSRYCCVGFYDLTC